MLTTKRLVALAGVATAAVLLQYGVARASTASDRPAAIVVYPKIVADSAAGIDTVITLTNADRSNPVRAKCFYVNATSHCSSDGSPCTSSAECGIGSCVPGWAETDFYITLTRDQPFYWVASTGRNSVCASNGTCEPFAVRASRGRCNDVFGTPCSTNGDCGGGFICEGATSGNAGTSIPPVADDPFVGELKCIEVNSDGTPATAEIGRNDLTGTATIVSNRGVCDGDPNIACFQATDCGEADPCVAHRPSAQSYNAVGLQTNRCEGGVRAGLACNARPEGVDAECPGGTCVQTVNSDNVLVIGGPDGEYSACPSTLILDHVFDGAMDPVNTPLFNLPLGAPGDAPTFLTDLTLVPCSEDLLLGSANLARSTAQFLVYNEFEQKLSASRQVNCFDEVLLSNIDTRNNSRSIFSVGVSGTIAGQTRIRAVGSGLLGVARVMKAPFPPAPGSGPFVYGPGAAYNLHQQGVRDGEGEEDVIVLP